MRIKSLLAGLLAGVLVLCNLSAVCYAAGGDAAPVSDTTVVAATDGDTADEDAKGEVSPISLPEGVTIDEDGNISISLEGFDWSMFTGNEDGEDEDAVPVKVGTVNVNSNTYLNLRSGGGMEYSVIGHLLRGTEVEVIGESGDWYEVVVPERTGFVHKNYLDVVEKMVTPGGTEAVSDFDRQMLTMFLYLMMNGIGSTDTTEPPSAALTPDGNLTLVDDYAENYEDGSGKQFITLVTKAGNTFYLVIDRDDKGEQNVHFMNLVDERDLLSLMDEDEAAEYTKEKPETPPPTVTEPEPTETDPPETEPEKKPGVNPAPVILLVIALLGGGGFFAFTKLKGRKKQQEQAKPDPDADYTDEDDEDFDLPEDIPVDDEDESEFYADDNEPV